MDFECVSIILNLKSILNRIMTPSLAIQIHKEIGSHPLHTVGNDPMKDSVEVGRVWLMLSGLGCSGVALRIVPIWDLIMN